MATQTGRLAGKKSRTRSDGFLELSTGRLAWKKKNCEMAFPSCLRGRSAGKTKLDAKFGDDFPELLNGTACWK